MNQVKHYSNITNAKRACRAAGLKPEDCTLSTQEENGKKVFAYVQVVAEETPIVAEILAEQEAQAELIANAAVANVDPNKPRVSVIPKPCNKVWDIADNMIGSRRKDVIQACIDSGIAYYTARTQYQQWSQCQKEMAEREAKQGK